ncbi:hypothetical protein ABJI51_24045 [Amycolatopsis sp. NEAU-NG30]|uniref:Nucleotidyltransferase n=1 Tax=Amycolatopsis melonis TaxID=3156488 RepID=A0ABV0LIN9_9PSEU
MTIDLSASTEPEIVRAARVLTAVNAAAQAADVDYLVVGATARTILSIGLAGTAPERATRDVDIAVEVATWADFDHRLNVRGLREATASAETVVLPGGLTVRVPAAPELALLKLLTWWERRMITTRDAIDLATMISWYSTGPYLDLLYEEESALLAQHEYDPALAGAWLLGSLMPRLLDDAGKKALLRIVADDDVLGRLANDARGTRAPELMRAMGAGIRHAVGM